MLDKTALRIKRYTLIMVLMQKVRLRFFGLLLGLVAISCVTGCVRPYSTAPVQKLTEPNLALGHVTTAEMIEKTLEAAATCTQTADSLPMPSLEEEPVYSVDIQQTLLLFPLHTGTAWVYEYSACSGEERSVWKIIDTVVETHYDVGYFSARIERKSILIEGRAGYYYLDIPQAGNYWYVLEGTKVFRFLESPVLEQIDQAWLEFIFPFPQSCWYPEGMQRLAGDEELLICCRSVEKHFTQILPTGDTVDCTQLSSASHEGDTLLIFCDGVGIVGGSSEGLDSSHYYVFELTAYIIQ